MRTITAAQQAVIDSGSQSDHVRVSVKDSGGTFRDLTTYPGFNALRSVKLGERIDDPHMTCDFAVSREFFKFSLAPYMTASAINKGFNPAGSYSPIIAINREVKVEVAIVAMGAQPASGDWMEVFRGRIDNVDSAAGDDVRVECRSLGGRLAQQFIKTELVYAFAADGGSAVALRVWEPQMVVTLGSYLLPATRGSSDSGYNRFFKCSQAGTTGTSEPTWTTGTNITDGTAKWDYVAAPTSSGVPVQNVMQNILDNHKASGDATVTLYTPTSPGWAIRQFIQRREFVLDAVRSLAKQIGWDVRYKWRSGTGQFELTLYQPERSSPSLNYTFSASDYESPTRMSVGIANIRNAWRVVYSDRTDLWPDGTPKRKVVEVSDATSIAKYGELWAEIREDENSQIDTVTEATALANAALSDCKEPNAELSVPLTRAFPWVELNDYMKLTANGLHFDADQSLAVSGWSHTYDAERKSMKTTLELRGLPSIGTAAWLTSTVHPSIIPTYIPPAVSAFNGAYTPWTGIDPNIGGGVFKIETGGFIDKLALDEEREIHVWPKSWGSSYPLSSTTLKEVARGPGKVLKSYGDMYPGREYYTRAVPRYRDHGRVLRGQPSQPVLFTASRNKAAYYDPSSAPGVLPLNGNFEHQTEAGQMPDQWEVVNSAWDSTGPAHENFGDDFASVFSEDDGVWIQSDASKGNYIILKTGINDSQRGYIKSSRFSVRRGLLDVSMYASIKHTTNGTTSVDDLTIMVYGFTLSTDTTPALALVKKYSSLSSDPETPTNNVWYDVEWNLWDVNGNAALPSTVNFIEVHVWRGGGDSANDYGNVEWHIGDVFCEPTGQYTTRAKRVYALNFVRSEGTLEVVGNAYFESTSEFWGVATFNDVADLTAGATIAQEAWTAPTFATNWGNVGGVWMTVAYMKDSMGFIRLRGLPKITTSTLTTLIFTLPTGYRPSARLQFPVRMGTNVISYVEIRTDGQVHYAGSGGSVLADAQAGLSLDGMNFDTR